MPFVAPELVTPAPYEVSFGRIAGRASPATTRIVVSIDGRVRAEKPIGRPRFDFWVALPQRDVRVTVTAVDKRGRHAATAVEPVFGLPRASAPRAPPRRSVRDVRLASELRALGREFPGICGILVEDLRDGAQAAWNVRAHFPAASTLKVAIAVEVLRVLRGKPWRGSRVDRLLRRMLIPSDDKAANELLIWLGGTISGGAARVNSTLQALALYDTDMYGGYLVQANEPSFVGKRTTASDYASLLGQIHFAAEGKGRLARRFRGSFIPADARHLLYLLAHTTTGWLDRFLSAGQAMVVQKAGWITRARHDGGLVYWPGGTFVAVVLTWNERGVGVASDVLAGRVARAALARLSRKG
jgi:beta-lactamase class A